MIQKIKLLEPEIKQELLNKFSSKKKEIISQVANKEKNITIKK